MERSERLEAANRCADKYTDEKEKRIAKGAFMDGCEFEAQGEAIKGVNLSTLESEKPMNPTIQEQPVKFTKVEAKALITLCVDEGLKQGIITASEFEELLDYLDELNHE